MKQIGVLLTTLLLFSFQSIASFDFNNRLSNAYLHIIRLELTKGRALLEIEKKQNPENKLTLLFENYVDFLKVFVSEESKDFEAFKANSSVRYKLIEDEKDKSPWLYFSLAEIKLQESFLKIKFKEYVSAALQLRTSFKYLNKNIEIYPDFFLNRKNLGIIHTVIGSVPPEYRWLTELSGMNGSVLTGMNEISQVLNELKESKWQAYYEEVLFYKAIIQSSLGFSKKEMQNTTELLRPLISVNPLLKYNYFNLCIRNGNSSEALSYIQKNQQSDQEPFHALGYKEGILLLYQLDLGAEKYFMEFINHFHGSSFIKSSLQKLAWICLLKGDVGRYTYYMQQISARGTTFTDEDKLADSESKMNQKPNIYLLRSRLLFDGGHYNKALIELINTPVKNFISFRDQLEFTYRLARIYHAQEKKEKAKDLYRITYNNGKSVPYYFSANSALLLGNIYEDEEQGDSAVYYYKKCLELRPHEYQNSIDQKAKAGLDRIKE